MDETADFLAREQQALGDDAAFFHNEQNASPSQQSALPTQTGQDDWGTFDISSAASSARDFPSTFQPAQSPNAQMSSYSPSSTGSASMSLAGDAGGTVSFVSSHSTGHAGGASRAIADVEEPDVIKEWRERFQQQIEERDFKSKTRHAETVAAAKQSLERFYNDYNADKSKGVAKNRELEKKEADKRDDVDKGNVWERAVKHIETAASSTSGNLARLKASKPATPGSALEKEEAKEKTKSGSGSARVRVRDTARMKEVLKSLIKDGANAPGIVA
ncbi:hypothetical protein SeMB42_g02312 [Synchytrium endobioticum]|uniref:Clathrin light chain n=1 Tax=Synchytrium endobioticum TaxID=286115 RepID=A0A507DEW3_9FUNG|nr:hypothetical protein SeLEV6574_g03105 [Synchytrium endobioticum]TPX50239.1 hypothetical protein SeMB42_g02312 [Synchytrium endobioticum]